MPVGEDPNFDKDENSDDVDTVCIIETLSLQVRPTDSGTLLRVFKIHLWRRSCVLPENVGQSKETTMSQSEKFRKIADSVFVMAVYCMEPEW